MSAVAIRLLRDERRRSEARVEALLRLAAGTGADTTGLPVADPAGELPFDARDHGAADEAAGTASRLERFAPAEEAVAVGSLFADQPETSPWRSRIVAAAACAAVLLLGAAAASFWPARSAGSSAATVAAGLPIELLSLQHSTEGNSLTVTGLVQNPRGGRELSQVTAVALVFSADGTFLGSSRSPLDFTRLGPGEESPFVVRVTAPGAVARYRVSFRDAGGSVVPHVDRRSADAVARKE